ncbi:hypothetical protein ACFEMC_02270 [Kineococcus sp. DHX-1]|uniref:hypothetical protein n=1 Tax=Kineococcus sp. DHX-1 TaxID=3349638 RepID=UPI0036D423E1
MVHTGETFTGEHFVAFDRDHPGGWRFTVADLVEVSGEEVPAPPGHRPGVARD